MKRLFLLAFVCLLSVVSLWGQNSATGNITATSSTCGTNDTSNTTACVVLPLNNNSGTVVINLGGTFVGTLQFEVTATNGASWAAKTCYPTNSTTGASSATATGTWTCPATGGLSHVRVRGSAYTSGTVNVQINQSSASASLGTGGGGGGTPGGSNTQLQYNNSGAFGGDTSTTDGSGNITATSYATTGSNGGVSGVEGDGSNAGCGATKDCLYPDSTAHRFKMNNNNAGAVQVVGISTAGTSGNCVKLAANGVDIVDNGSACSVGGSSVVVLAYSTQGVTGGTAVGTPLYVGLGNHSTSAQAVCVPESITGSTLSATISAFTYNTPGTTSTLDYTWWDETSNVTMSLTCNIGSAAHACNGTGTVTLTANHCYSVKVTTNSASSTSSWFAISVKITGAS